MFERPPRGEPCSRIAEPRVTASWRRRFRNRSHADLRSGTEAGAAGDPGRSTAAVLPVGTRQILRAGTWSPGASGTVGRRRQGSARAPRGPSRDTGQGFTRGLRFGRSKILAHARSMPGAGRSPSRKGFLVLSRCSQQWHESLRSSGGRTSCRIGALTALTQRETALETRRGFTALRRFREEGC